ncbi:MAG: pilin [Candidatus Marithrix sp.]
MTKGFIFIDIMVTVAIIGILAAVAIPAYSDYLAKSKIAEISLLLITVKKAVGDYYAYHGKFPINSKTASIPELIKGNYVAGIKVNSGAIEITLRTDIEAQIAGGVLNLQPIVSDSLVNVGIMNWTCSSTLDNRYLPKYCRS